VKSTSITELSQWSLWTAKFVAALTTGSAIVSAIQRDQNSIP